jgi:DNA helicase HerA-like ATPase
MLRAADLLGMDRRTAEMFRDLKRGSFVALGPALSRRPLKVTIGAVETSARSTSPKLMPLPEAPQDVEDLIFTPDADELTRPIMRRAVPPPRPATDILAELSRPRPEPVAPVETRPAQPEMSAEERGALLDGLFTEILANPDAAFRPDAELFQDFLVRCRIRRVPGAALSLSAFRRKMAIARSGVDTETAATEAWASALRLADRVTEDLQGVFLMMAQAAVRGLACPSDAMIARAYGTHSARRARRLLGYFEENGLVVVHADFTGKRIVAFPDLGHETAPGDANGPDAMDPSAAAAE